MIIEFSAKNFRSIKDLQTISFVASSLKSKNQEVDESNIIQYSDKFQLLKSIAIYGANGSGKSNIVRAMICMLITVRDSMKDDNTLKNYYQPFLLNESSKESPTYFQIQFILNGHKYRYGFEADNKRIVSEWLFGPAEKKEVYYFTREENSIKINENQFKEGKSLEDKTTPQNLFLNVVKAFNGKLTDEIKKYFVKRIAISAGVADFGLRSTTLDMIKDDAQKKQILNLLNVADFGINDIEEQHIKKEKGDREGEYNLILSKRLVLNDEGKHVGITNMMMDSHESEGTQKIFNYAGAIIRALTMGYTLILDEFDARLHSSLTKKIVQMFNSNVNSKNAQLVFVTHDTNLLDSELLRRDQIYFAEKKQRISNVFLFIIRFQRYSK